MGIDIYARWTGQTHAEEADQITGFDPTAGAVGYLREPFHGGAYATEHLVPEAFVRGGARIPSARLRARLPEALKLAEERQRKLNGDATELEKILQSFTAFVELCERMEAKTGQPVKIVASW